MIKPNNLSDTSQMTDNSKRFGLGGEAPPIEYVVSFIQEYIALRKNFTIPRRMTHDELGYLCKAAWIAFNRELTPSEYLQTLFSKYRRMPSPAIPRPDQLVSAFSVDVVDSEVVKKVEVPSGIRAHDLAKKNHFLRLDQDSQYRCFVAEFESVELSDIEDVEFKVTYCRMREIQSTGEPTEFIEQVMGRLAVEQFKGSIHE